jgi:hypothetical protein
LAKNPEKLPGDRGKENTGGPFTGFLAEEDEFDRRALWRLGSWGFAAVGAITLAVLANQTSLGWRREQLTAADVARQAQQFQILAKESQNEARRLAAAVETLNSDRDRLYARVTTLELGLDSVTGAIAQQRTAAAPPQAEPPASPAPSEPAANAQSPAPVVAAVAATPSPPESEKPPVPSLDQPPLPAEKSPVVAADTPVVPSSENTDIKAAARSPGPAPVEKSMIGPPAPAAGKPIDPTKNANTVTASVNPEVAVAAASAGDGAADAGNGPKAAVQRTEFGVDLGGANSLPGLRALWRGLLKSRSNAPLFTLRPIISIKEGTNRLGMQLRLVAGPLSDAGAAAKICAVLAENNRPCETAIYDGQQLTMKDEPQASVPSKAAPRRRAEPKHTAARVVEEAPKQPETSAASKISAFFGRKSQ